jgi:1-acyl-sn-glycerol-3-phosphate acyltransferase
VRIAQLANSTVRRAVTVPAVAMSAATLAGSIGLWAPATAAFDLVHGRTSVPRTRMLSLALAWSSLESIGVGISAGLWATGRSNDRELHFTVQRWWADRLLDALRQTTNVRFEVEGVEQLAPGPLIICSRHASIFDSLIPVWLLGQVGMRPRYVLKDDLQLDPCLDIFGNRLPNHFIDRDPTDNGSELTRLEQLARGMDARDACVIFPEGTVVTDARRERAVAAIAARDPERGRRVGQLRALGPVRPGGTVALMRGAPDADLVFVAHAGLETLDHLLDAVDHIPLGQPVRVEIARVARRDVPTGDDFYPWFDAEWAKCDGQVVEMRSRRSR